MDPFHDEVGYLLWEKATGQIMRAVVFGRGIAILAGGDAKPRDTVLRFDVKPGSPNSASCKTNTCPSARS